MEIFTEDLSNEWYRYTIQISGNLKMTPKSRHGSGSRIRGIRSNDWSANGPGAPARPHYKDSLSAMATHTAKRPSTMQVAQYLPHTKLPALMFQNALEAAKHV